MKIILLVELVSKHLHYSDIELQKKNLKYEEITHFWM